MNDPVKRQKQRSLQYWYVDGLAEMAIASVFLLMAVNFLIIYNLPDSFLTAILVGVGQPLIIILGVLFTGKLVRNLKERVTYPRTGYIKYQTRKGKKRWIHMFFTMFLSAFFAAASSLTMNYLDDMQTIIFIGLLMAFAMLIIANRIRLMRFYLIALGVFLLSLLLAWFLPGSIYTFSIFFGGLGSFWLVSGILTFVKYLRSTRALTDLDEQEEADEG